MNTALLFAAHVFAVVAFVLGVTAVAMCVVLVRRERRAQER